MARLPSGLHCTIDIQPWNDLVNRIEEDCRNRHSLRFLPEFLQVQRPDDLRRYVRLLWIVPMTADSARLPQFNHHLKRLKPGWIALDSGYTLDRLPDQLSARDRYAINARWQDPEFQACLGPWLQIVTNHRNRLLAGNQPILRFIASCYPAAPAPAEARVQPGWVALRTAPGRAPGAGDALLPPDRETRPNGGPSD